MVCMWNFRKIHLVIIQVNFVLPAVLINIISLFVFMMPSESGEKITLAISAMLNMTVFLMAVVDDLPPTDKTSIISYNPMN